MNPALQEVGAGAAFPFGDSVDPFQIEFTKSKVNHPRRHSFFGCWHNHQRYTALSTFENKCGCLSLLSYFSWGGCRGSPPIRQLLRDSVAPVWGDGRPVVRDAVDLLGITVLRDDRLRAEGTTVKSKHALIGFVAVLTMVLGIFMTVRRIGAACRVERCVPGLGWSWGGLLFGFS